MLDTDIINAEISKCPSMWRLVAFVVTFTLAPGWEQVDTNAEVPSICGSSLGDSGIPSVDIEREEFPTE